MSDNNIILVINILLYLVTLILYQRKKKRFGVGSLVLCLYTLCAIIALDLFNSPLTNFKDLTLFPFLYLYFCLMLIFTPLLKFDEEKISNLKVNNDIGLNALSILLIVISFAYYTTSLKDFSISNIFDPLALATSYAQSEEAKETMLEGSNYLKMLEFVLRIFSVPLLAYNLLRKNKLLIIGVLAVILMQILTSLTSGSRVYLVQVFMAFPFIYIVLNKSLAPTIKRTILLTSGIILSVLVIGFAAITIGRNESNNTENLVVHSLKNYAGQSFIVFNNYGLDANGIRYGDRTAPLIKMALGLRTSINYYERRFLFRNMSVDDSYFSTFVGDFTLDYGPVYALVILILFSLFFQSLLKLKKGKYHFSQIIALYILYHWCVMGFALWFYGEKLGNVQFLLILLLYYYTKIRETKFRL